MVITAAGYILGHKHAGRMFPVSAHSTAASLLIVPLLSQAGMGLYLKLHIHENTIRPWMLWAHGILYVSRLPVGCFRVPSISLLLLNCITMNYRGKFFPILGWAQMLFGAILLGDYCNGEELGQCLGTCFVRF